MLDLHQTITDKLIAKMEAGNVPWHRAWNGSANFDMPINGTTNKYYQGVNTLLLWASAQDNQFDTQEWGSFKQWQAQKQTVAKGQKGTTIIYYDTIEKKTDDKIEKIPFIKSSYVFNRCQLQNYKPQQKTTRPLIDRLAHVDQYILNTGAKVYHDGGNNAYYNKLTDDIHLPVRDAFIDTESMYAVTMHELTHWTGAKDRCNRVFGKRFGDKAYAFEELVGEIGSAFNCAALEITNEPRDDHASYIQNWLQVLKDDKKAVFTAASEASKAVAFLNSFQAI